MVGYNNRFAPSNQILKKYVESGDLGEIYYARAQSLRRRGIPGWGVFIDKAKQGGGPLVPTPVPLPSVLTSGLIVLAGMAGVGAMRSARRRCLA